MWAESVMRKEKINLTRLAGNDHPSKSCAPGPLAESSAAGIQVSLWQGECQQHMREGPGS